MTVLSVAYPLLPVRPDSGGGAEQILLLLERGITKAGHTSVVVAAESSQISGELIATPLPEGEITENVRQSAQHDHLRAIQQALERYPIDLVHLHGLDFYRYLPVQPVPPLLATLHLPIAWYPNFIFQIAGLTLNCVSKSQAESAAESNNLPVVFNGVDIDQSPDNVIPSGLSPRDYDLLVTGRCLVFLGRICPEKGVDVALRVAHELDLPLMVAGPVHPFKDHQVYFSDCIQPLLDQKRRYIGPVGPEAKTILFAKAHCVLVPSRVAETSSLVAMESISAGTPVIAFRSGALPEVVEQGVTGFLVNSEKEMRATVEGIDYLSRKICRSRARARFNARRMVLDYLTLYEKLLHSRVRISRYCGVG